MQKITVLLSVLVISFFIIGCVESKFKSASPETVAKLDFGSKPKKVKVAKIGGAFENELKDPYSAKIKLVNMPLIKGYMTNYNGKIYWKGWVTTVEVNAKNSYGGYTGNKFYYVPLSYGEGIAAFGLSDESILKVIK